MEICDIVCAPTINSSFLPHLQSLTQEYLYLRTSCFPKIQLRSKHHYLLHFAYLIAQFGALIKVWTLRFEAKHSFFKNLVRSIKNFKNLCRTLSVKHELYQFLLRNFNFATKHLITPVCAKEFDPSTYTEAIINTLNGLSLSNSLMECNSIEIGNITFECGDVIALGSNAYHETINVGSIRLIVVDLESKNAFFVTKTSQATFECNTQTYIRSSPHTDKFECLSFKDLYHKHPLHVYHLNNERRVKLEHELVRSHI